MALVWTIMFGVAAGVYFIWGLRKFEKAVLALPLIFPLYLVKMELRGIPFNFVEAVVILLVLAFLIRGIHQLRVRKALSGIAEAVKASGIPATLFVLLIILIAAAVVSTLITEEKTLMLDGVTTFFGRRTALGVLKGWIVIPAAVFAMFLISIKKSRDILKMVDYYTLSSVLLALYAIFQVITAHYTTPDARASGPFESANYLALYIAPALVYSLIRVKESLVSLSEPEKGFMLNLAGLLKHHVRRSVRPLEHLDTMAFSGAFLILLLALLFSKSYAAMVAVLVSLIVFFSLEYYQYFKSRLKRGFPWKGILVVAALVLLGAAVVYILDPVKWNNLFNFAVRNSSSVRIQVYSIAGHLLQSHWLTGIGLGQFPLYYQLESLSVLGRPPYELNMLHPHNFYVALWLNLGISGFLAVMGVIYLCFRECCAHAGNFAWAKVTELSKIRVIGLSLLVIILVHGFFDTPFFKNDLALIFWLIAAMILAPAKKEN